MAFKIPTFICFVLSRDSKPISLKYTFVEIQPIQFIVWDGNEIIGELECTVGDIVSYRGDPFTKRLM
jgi:hypothetical protein